MMKNKMFDLICLQKKEMVHCMHLWKKICLPFDFRRNENVRAGDKTHPTPAKYLMVRPLV